MTGGAGELAREVAVHMWGLQLRYLLPSAAVAQHSQQLILLLGEAQCRGVMPCTRLQGTFAHLLVTALSTAHKPLVLRVRSLIQPVDALRLWPWH